MLLPLDSSLFSLPKKKPHWEQGPESLWNFILRDIQSFTGQDPEQADLPLKYALPMGGGDLDDRPPDIPCRLDYSGSDILPEGTNRWFQTIKLAGLTSYCLPDEMQYLTGCDFWLGSSQNHLMLTLPEDIFHLPDFQLTETCQLNCLPSPDPFCSSKCSLWS